MVVKEGGHYVKANKEESSKMEHGVPCDSDDSKDSDTLQLFELPKRKLVRPISSSLRRKVRETNKCWATTKECCRVFASVTVPMLVAVFVVSTVLCLAFLLIGIAGMKQEISILKSRIKNFDAAEKNFLEKKEQLRKGFQDKLNNMNKYQTELQLLKNSVNRVHFSIAGLNTTIHSFHRKPTPELSSKVSELKNDLETVKTGMADTGADIEKLKANSKTMLHNVRVLRKKVDDVRRQLYNMTVKVSLLEHKEPPPFVAPTTTPKMLVVTITPDKDKPVPRKELAAMLEQLEKRQSEHCTKEVAAYDKRLIMLQNETHLMHDKYTKEINTFHKFMDSFHPSTTHHPSTAVLKTSHLSNSTSPPQTVAAPVNVSAANATSVSQNKTIDVLKTLEKDLSKALKDHDNVVNSNLTAVQNNVTIGNVSQVLHSEVTLLSNGSSLHTINPKGHSTNKTKT